MTDIDDEGGDAPCWAHLFEDDETDETQDDTEVDAGAEDTAR